MSDLEEKEKVASSASGGPLMAVKPPVEVEVIATRDWDKGVEFMLRWEFPKGSWNSGPMVFAKDDFDRVIEYSLNDQTGLDLAFDNQVHDCIWVTEGACPTLPPRPGSDRGQIGNRSLKSKTELKVENKNNVICHLHYALRFTGKKWDRPDGKKSFGPEYNFDPDYRNTGGGGSNT